VMLCKERLGNLISVKRESPLVHIHLHFHLHVDHYLYAFEESYLYYYTVRI
jgi:hypothetical protein